MVQIINFKFYLNLIFLLYVFIMHNILNLRECFIKVPAGLFMVKKGVVNVEQFRDTYRYVEETISRIKSMSSKWKLYNLNIGFDEIF